MSENKVKALEEKIASLEQDLRFYEQFVSNFPQQVWAVGEKGILKARNHNLENKLDVQIGSSIYKAMKQLSPFMAESVKKNDEMVKKSDNVLVFEEIGNEDRVYLSFKKRVVDALTKEVYVIGVSIDMTEQKKREEKLLSALKEIQSIESMRECLTGAFRHDLQTPISNIKGAVSLMKVEGVEKDWDFFSDSIAASVQRLEEYIAFLSKSNERKQNKEEAFPIVKKEVNIKQLIAEVASGLMIKMKEKNLGFEIEAEDDFPELLITDPLRLSRVLTNLITNAVKYTKEGSIAVEIMHTPVDDRIGLLEILVKDTGVGVDESKLEAIFSPFYRVKRKDLRHIEGKGLGLSIVRSFLTDLKGYVGITSKLGEGSTFYVSMPIGRVVKHNPEQY